MSQGSRPDRVGDQIRSEIASLLAPVSVGVTIAFFRRRELLKLAPLVLVLVVMIPVVSPGAIHGVLAQVSGPGSTHVATVSDRTADYDAVRAGLTLHWFVLCGPAVAIASEPGGPARVDATEWTLADEDGRIVITSLQPRVLTFESGS